MFNFIKDKSYDKDMLVFKVVGNINLGYKKFNLKDYNYLQFYWGGKYNVLVSLELNDVVNVVDYVFKN